MPVCSYLVIPEAGAGDRVRRDLEALPECDVVAAENQDVLILVTDTVGLAEEERLRVSVEAMDGIQTLLLTFGEIDPDTELADPISVGRKASRSTDRPILPQTCPCTPVRCTPERSLPSSSNS